MLNVKIKIMLRVWVYILGFMLLSITNLFAQDNLLDMIDKETEEETVYTSATFKASRIINGQSVEQMKARQLDVKIHHRFGPLNSGVDGFWGLDESNVYLGMEYGVTNNLMLSIGRTSIEKTINGSLKYRLFQQSTGKKNMPVSLSLFTAMNVKTAKWPYPDRKDYFSNRLTYVFQILIARKFNEKFSLQLSPTMVHRNLVKEATDLNDIFALGIGGRFKLTKRVSINAEYFPVLRPLYNFDSFNETNSLSIGFDIETGGHVFQIMFTNSVGMIEKGFIGETTDKWKDGGIRLGFNISRVFSLR
jgi:hypothetical protein